MNFAKESYKLINIRERKLSIMALKFIYFEKAIKFCEISTVDLTVTTQDKSKVVISVSFSQTSTLKCIILDKNRLKHLNLLSCATA